MENMYSKAKEHHNFLDEPLFRNSYCKARSFIKGIVESSVSECDIPSLAFII